MGSAAVASGTLGGIAGAEIVYTFLLVFVVLNTAAGDAPNHYFGLAIGFCLVIGAAAVGGISGGVFNPAIALALDFSGIFALPSQGFDVRYGWGWYYVLLEFIGALLAAAFYKLVRDDDS